MAGWLKFFTGKSVAGACHKRWRCVLIDGHFYALRRLVLKPQAFPKYINYSGWWDLRGRGVR